MIGQDANPVFLGSIHQLFCKLQLTLSVFAFSVKLDEFWSTLR